MPSLETIKLFSMLMIVAAAYLFTSQDDYHKKFDKQITFEYNCRMVLDNVLNAPQFVIDECKDGRRFVIVKTNQE